jgi:hypothetical protein
MHKRNVVSFFRCYYLAIFKLGKMSVLAGETLLYWVDISEIYLKYLEMRTSCWRLVVYYGILAKVSLKYYQKAKDLKIVI